MFPRFAEAGGFCVIPQHAMASSKRTAAKAKAKAAAAAAPVDEPPAANRALLQQLADDIAVITAHPLFAKIQESDPATIDAKLKDFSGHQAAFDASACAMALTSQGKYKCGANLFWINQLWSAAPEVPINPSAVDRLSSYYLETPGPVPMDLIIVVRRRLSSRASTRVPCSA